MACVPGVVELHPEHFQALAKHALRAARLFASVAAQRHCESTFKNTFNEYAASLADAYAVGQDRYEAIDRTARRRLRQAYKARDFICAHIDEQIPIPRLCAAIGVSRRQLEYAFFDAFDVSPRDFIHLRRLNEIRRALIEPRGSERTVTEVAFEHGVSHLGCFAVSYRALFGESPGETARYRPKPHWRRR